jgi:hypothetical protein
MTERVRQILNDYGSDDPGTLANLARLLGAGKLGRTTRPCWTRRARFATEAGSAVSSGAMAFSGPRIGPRDCSPRS